MSEWQRHRKGDPFPVGPVVFTEGVWHGIDTNHNEAATWTHDGWHLILPPLPKEPRRMSVWEWRKHPEVEFVVCGQFRYKWQGHYLYSMDMHGSPPPMWTDSQLLEAEGVEVLP